MPRGRPARGAVASLIALAVVTAALLASHDLSARQDALVLRIADYATLPMTGTVDGTQNVAQLARVNMMREEPGGTGRFFVNDLNGPLYILDKGTRTFTTYLDFNGVGDRPGLFDRLYTLGGFANGLIAFQFDPDYPTNGIFYTIHLEDPSMAGSAMPDKTSVPGLDLAGYATTPPVETPGRIEREAVLIQWTDTNVHDATFTGTARELLRVQMNTRIHPMGDLIFNPTARPGDPDWRVLYVACGDGGSGEQQTALRPNPQRLDTLVGKILRIIPDLKTHTATSTVSDNGRYRIPRDNPFASTPGARKEIWAYGFRNPHRLVWDVNPASPADNHLITTSIGLHTWESVDIVHKGANYGYSEREGNQWLKPDNTVAPLPPVDRIPVRVGDTRTIGTVTPTYPVIQYAHDADGGDAIAGGFVYRGHAVPALAGKFVFGDISTGRVWWADFKEMLAADDGKPGTEAARHEIHLRWDAPAGADASGGPVYPSMFEIVRAAYHARGGTDASLPGSATVAAHGRADIRLAEDAAGELYILSKSDGLIRAIIGAN